MVSIPGIRWVIEPLFIIDGFGVFNTGLILLTSLAATMVSYAYFEQREERKEEYYILLILATLGAAVLVISKHFVSLFLGLEILSVSLYSMIAYLRTRPRSDEAGIKYLIMAAFSSAFLLFGMALVYATTGKMEFSGIATYLESVNDVPVVFLAGDALGVEAVSFYLVAYFVTSLGAFGIIATLSDKDRDAEMLEDYKGLLWRRPWTAALLSAMLLSLAGIPLTAGFVGKFYVIAAGVHTHHWLLVVMLAVNSVLGLYYYIKIIAIMFEQHEGDVEPVGRLHPTAYIVSGVTMAILALLLVWFGIYPEGLMTLIKNLVPLN